MVEWIKKNKSHSYAAYRRLTSDAGHTVLKMKEWKKIFHAKQKTVPMKGKSLPS